MPGGEGRWVRSSVQEWCAQTSQAPWSLPGQQRCTHKEREGQAGGRSTACAAACRRGSPAQVPLGSSGLAHIKTGWPSEVSIWQPVRQPPVQPQPKTLQVEAPQVDSRPAARSGGGAGGCQTRFERERSNGALAPWHIAQNAF